MSESIDKIQARVKAGQDQDLVAAVWQHMKIEIQQALMAAMQQGIEIGQQHGRMIGYRRALEDTLEHRRQGPAVLQPRDQPDD